MGIRVQTRKGSLAHSGRRWDCAAGHRYAPVRIPAFARGTVEGHTGDSSRLRAPLRTRVSIQSPLSLQSAVRCQYEWARAQCSAGRFLEVRVWWARTVHSAVAGPGGLEARRTRWAVRHERYRAETFAGIGGAGR